MRTSMALLGVTMSVLLCACTSSTPKPVATSAPRPAAHAVTGVVLDERTGNPIPRATVSVGGAQVVADQRGVFTLAAVVNGPSTITVASKYYTAKSMPGPAARPYRLVVRLQPVSVEITANGNLTHGPIPAQIKAAGVTVNAKNGTATVYQVAEGDQVVVTAAGYRPATATLTSARSVSVTLEAGPGVTAQYLANAEIQQRYGIQADFVHPQELKYVTRQHIISQQRKSDDDGYSLVRWNLKSVTIIPRWRFPGCAGAGVKTFTNVAAVEFTAVNSAPQGASQSTHGVEHLVQTSRGLWDWFPIVTGCE